MVLTNREASTKYKDMGAFEISAKFFDLAVEKKKHNYISFESVLKGIAGAYWMPQLPYSRRYHQCLNNY